MVLEFELIFDSKGTDEVKVKQGYANKLTAEKRQIYNIS